MIDILIPTCKDKEDISLLIEEIKRTATGSYNIIVSSNQLYSASENRNACLNQSTAEFVIFCDDDLGGFVSGWNEKLIEGLSQLDVSVVSARLMKKDGTPGIMCAEQYNDSTRFVLAKSLPTACIAFKHTNLRFDETFIGSGYEDNDYLNQLGGKYLIDNNVRVIHYNEQKNQQGKYWEFNRDYFLKKWCGDFKFVALYKTLTGGEWVQASLESIYPYVNSIVFVHSDLAWGGLKANNDCIEPVKEWKEKYDAQNKIHEICSGFKTQEEQYEEGIHYIRKHFGNVYILIIDVDEIWDYINLQKLFGKVICNPDYHAYSCSMYTYVKSPFYRVDPSEICRPVVVVNSKLMTETYGPRWSGCSNRLICPDIFMHHFTYVREKEESVKNKLICVETGDKMEYNKDWFEKVWPLIPNVKNFHATLGWEHSWKGIKTVKIEDLPLSVRNHPLILKGSI